MFDTNFSLLTETIKCDDDCLQSGCPGHLLQLKIQSTSGTGELIKDGETILYMDRGEANALFKMFKIIENE